MAHLLIIELPGGHDSDILQAASARGDRCTFLTAQLAPYLRQPAVQAALATARALIEVPAFDAAEVDRRVLAAHAACPFDAVLCLVAGRVADAARLAQRLQLRHLNPATAALLCQRLKAQAQAQAPAQGAQRGGRLIGCDTFSFAGRHRLLGVHDKLLHAPPSRALRGSTYTPNSSQLGADFTALEAQLQDLLDGVGFDWGAAHIELLRGGDGPRLLAIQPCLAGARMPRLAGYALGRSLHADLIALHLGQPLPAGSGAAPQVAVLRGIAAAQEGLLDEVVLPPWQDPAIRCVEMLRQPGEAVRAPLVSDDSLGHVMVCGPARADAEQLAEHFVARTLVRLHPAAAASAAVLCSTPHRALH